ncbi:MAG: hypothetical protein KDC32_22165, partial [Saprospiraceae bacterium]|nr:hypothetical protein [Saprospiraceae bacterium]
MKTIKWICLLALPFWMASCSPTLSPFTRNLLQENRWSDDELKRIQFYLSNDIVLHRKLDSGASTISDGEIKIINGQEVEEVVIRRGTPGVFLFRPKADHFAVSFESTGNDQRFLMFGPNPKLDGRFVLLASEWERRQGKVTYDGVTYWVDAD